MWCLRENKVAVSIKSTKIYGKGNVPCKVGGQNEYRGADVVVVGGNHSQNRRANLFLVSTKIFVVKTER